MGTTTVPQEYWIHIAQLDVTDVLGENPGLWVVIAVGAAGAAVALKLWSKALPATDWGMSLAVDTHPTKVLTTPADPTRTRFALLDHPLVEKTVLVGLVITIFLQLVPNSEASVMGVTLGAGAIVAASAYVSYWLGSRGRTWALREAASSVRAR